MADCEKTKDGPDHHRARSEFIRSVLQRPEQASLEDRYKQRPPKTIVQFWHNLKALPRDVEECIDSWARWESSAFAHHLFDEVSAKAFICNSLDARHERAFERCYHPAMQADYFRLCYLLVEGGLYIDADDVCISTELSWLFDDGRLKAQPLCYDIASETMVNAPDFLHFGAYSPSWIFYFNNNPLIAAPGHPIIERALMNATNSLEQVSEDKLPEIQATTGPGNLSKSIFELGKTSSDIENGLTVLRDWNSCAVSRWPLSYRGDDRNWRLSNQRRYQFNKEYLA